MASILKTDEIQSQNGGSVVKMQTLKHPSASGNNLVLASDGSATIANGTLSAGTIGSSVTGNWGWKLLQTATASGSDTSLTIGNATHLSSTYSTYKIIMEDFVMPVSHALLAEFYIGGSLKTTSSYDFHVWGYDSANVSRKVQASQGDSYMYVTPIAFGPHDTDVTGISGEFTITQPSLTRWHGIRWHMDYCNNDNRTITAIGSGGHKRHRDSGDKGALTGVRFKSNNSSSNITRGTLRLYGVINA